MPSPVRDLALPPRQMRLQSRPALEAVSCDGVPLDVAYAALVLPLRPGPVWRASARSEPPIGGERLEPVVELDLARGRVVMDHQRPRVVDQHLLRHAAQVPGPYAGGVCEVCRRGFGRTRRARVRGSGDGKVVRHFPRTRTPPAPTRPSAAGPRPRSVYPSDRRSSEVVPATRRVEPSVDPRGLVARLGGVRTVRPWAGVEPVTALSGRVGLASELTSRGRLPRSLLRGGLIR